MKFPVTGCLSTVDDVVFVVFVAVLFLLDQMADER